MDDARIYQEIVSLQEAGKGAALATVVESSGSAPRKAGAKMLVRADGSTLGSIGGGKIELETIEAALEAVAQGGSRTVSFQLNEEYGHVCGGRVLVYIEPLASAHRLLIIGAGHVGKALARVASFAGFRVLIADERPVYADCSKLPGVTESFAGDPAAALAHLGVTEQTFIVIATTGYQQDFAAARAALKTPAPLIGMIGSKRKKAVLEQTLFEEGYLPADLKRVQIPVGLSIGAETPEEIAVSIVAQLVQTRRNHAAAGAGAAPGSREVAPDGMLQATVAAG